MYDGLNGIKSVKKWIVECRLRKKKEWKFSQQKYKNK
jgi:hypothetical protein